MRKLNSIGDIISELKGVSKYYVVHVLRGMTLANSELQEAGIGVTTLRREVDYNQLLSRTLEAFEEADRKAAVAHVVLVNHPRLVVYQTDTSAFDALGKDFEEVAVVDPAVGTHVQDWEPEDRSQALMVYSPGDQLDPGFSDNEAKDLSPVLTQVVGLFAIGLRRAGRVISKQTGGGWQGEALPLAVWLAAPSDGKRDVEIKNMAELLLGSGNDLSEAGATARHVPGLLPVLRSPPLIRFLVRESAQKGMSFPSTPISVGNVSSGDGPRLAGAYLSWAGPAVAWLSEVCGPHKEAWPLVSGAARSKALRAVLVETVMTFLRRWVAGFQSVIVASAEPAALAKACLVLESEFETWRRSTWRDTAKSRSLRILFLRAKRPVRLEVSETLDLFDAGT
jgi:hypothetical protein